MPNKPDVIYVTMMTTAPLKEKEGLQKLLNAFEDIEEFAPTHWGPDERARDPYERHEMLTSVSNFKTDFYVPGLHRRKPPKYQAYFSAKDSGVKDVKVEFSSQLRKKDVPRIFDLGNSLAEQLRPVFGFVHPIWKLGEESQDYSASGILKADDFNRYGPRAICARTWLGKHLVNLIGREQLESTDIIIQDMPWGGLQIDLVENPWEADFESLSSSQIAVMNNLKKSDVFGDYTELFKPKPGANWEPIF